MSAAALVVHDLKNELGALEAALQQLALQPAADAAAAAHRQCQMLRQRLVMYLAAYGAEGELRAVRDDESPAELLASVAARHAPPDGHIRIQLHADVGADAPPCAWFDRRLVGMALDAAMHNALRFAGSRITLGVHENAGQLVFSVDDDGPGLQPGVTADAHATGLGTTLCRAVARAHGVAEGGVRLETRAEGGARFELHLAT